MSDQFTIATEHYALRETPDDAYAEYWLEHRDGEGMSISAKELDQLLDEYFKENF